MFHLGQTSPRLVMLSNHPVISSKALKRKKKKCVQLDTFFNEKSIINTKVTILTRFYTILHLPVFVSIYLKSILSYITIFDAIFDAIFDT